MSAHLTVAPTVLQWAEARAQQSHHSFSGAFTHWADWLSGHGGPTVRQAEQIAKEAHVPFGSLFLADPPEFEIPLKDFRLGVGGDPSDPGPELRDVVQSCSVRQNWFEDYAAREGVAAIDLPRITRGDIVGTAHQAAQALTFTVDERAGVARLELRRRLRRAFERLGGLVVMTSMVGNDNHRPLDREEFRGFTLHSDIAPLIFINTHDDTLAGQFFTFFHELGHVLRSENALDNATPGHAVGDAERWCNAFAAEVLVPAADLRTQYTRDSGVSDEAIRLSGRYQCSPLVILLQMRDLGLIERAGFDEVYVDVEVRMRELARRGRTETSGGDFYRNITYRVGERLSRAVIADLRGGSTNYTDAFRLLGLRNTTQIDKYEQTLDS